LELKYQDDISEIKGCPPEACSPPAEGTVGFRFTGSSSPDAEDFVPVAKMQPQRTFQGAESKCTSYALSFFATKSQALNKRIKLVQQNAKLAQRYRCIASCDLTPEDGLIGPINAEGHFSLHESVTASYATTVSVVWEAS